MAARGGVFAPIFGGADWYLPRRTASADPRRPPQIHHEAFCNKIPTEPTVIAIPILTGDSDTGFGVRLSEDHWAATGLITSLRKSRLFQFERNVGMQLLTDVNDMLFRILATPER